MSNLINMVKLKKFLIQYNLMSADCFNILLIQNNFAHETCLKAAFSKLLGLALVAGAALVKLPQILKIFSSGSVQGLSTLGNILELAACTFTMSYSIANQYPFSTYGDAAFLSVQTSLIIFLILFFEGQICSSLVFTTVYGSLIFLLLQTDFVPKELLWFGQAANIPMTVIGKMIQVMANHKQGHTGQLSAITIFLLFFGSAARIFTSIQETGDQVMILTYISSTIVNGLLVAQLLYYWNDTNNVLKEAKTKKGL